MLIADTTGNSTAYISVGTDNKNPAYNLVGEQTQTSPRLLMHDPHKK